MNITRRRGMTTKVEALVAMAALLLNGVSSWAASGTSDVTVRIALVDKMTTTNGGTITLDNNDADPTVGGTLGPDSDTTGRFHYIHNKNVNKKITAQATTSPAAAGNDITLQAKIGAGAFVTLYNDAGAAAAQDILTALAAGVLTNQTITYQAQATAAGTAIGAQTDYNFTITYTSVDA